MPGLLLPDHALEEGGIHSAACVNPERKMLLTRNLAQPYFVMLPNKWQKNFLKIAAVGMTTSLIMLVFLKNYANNLRCDSQKTKIFQDLQDRDFQDLFSAFEVQEIIQTDKMVLKQAKMSNFLSKHAKSWFLKL